MDIAMPLLNGIEATQQIRAECPRTQVMILSIHFTSVHIQCALQAGAMGYLLKEFRPARKLWRRSAPSMKGGRYPSRKIAETVVEDYVRQGGSDVLEGLSPRASGAATHRRREDERRGGEASISIRQNCGDLSKPLHAETRLEGYDRAGEVRHSTWHHFAGAIVKNLAKAWPPPHVPDASQSLRKVRR